MARLPVLWSPRARTDLLKILGDIADGSGAHVAAAWNDRIWQRLELVAEHPGSGALRPRLGKSIRISVVKPYVIIYGHDEREVRVMRILHGRRRLTRKLVADTK